MVTTLPPRLEGDLAEAGERQQAERGHRQPLPGRVGGPALPGTRQLQERGRAAPHPLSGGQIGRAHV